MSSKLFSTSASKLSNATTPSHPSLFGRIVFRLKKAFKLFYIEEKDVSGPENLPEPSQEMPVHLPQEVDLIEQENTLVFDHATPESPVSSVVLSLPPSPTEGETAAASSILHLQVTSKLKAANRRIAELEAIVAKRRLEHAAYVQRVENMDMPHAIKKLTEERDLFRARLEPAKKEYARKAAERKLVEQEWKEEEERRLAAQLMVVGAKYGLEESAKQYAELEAKYLELQKQPESAQYEADQGGRYTEL